ncbi:hypothetical protein OsI_36105 [Oryza sativa Indica Group]|uniref:Uncharacterized protein n=1 Tax=Oryza sativa subsp. indica TaxID=39946 RepID=B8BKH8_ORYSI|nr:hypothetical protein OsI_36105 [Oryza sativa Indica Group]
MEQQLCDLMATMTSIQKQNESIKASVGSIEEIKPMVVELAGWKPLVEKAVTELLDEVGDLRAQFDLFVKTPTSPLKPEDLLPTPLGPKLPQVKAEVERVKAEAERSAVMASATVTLPRQVGNSVLKGEEKQTTDISSIFF